MDGEDTVEHRTLRRVQSQHGSESGVYFFRALFLTVRCFLFSEFLRSFVQHPDAPRSAF